MKKFIILLAVMAMATVSGYAQKLLWNADFDFRFDNREYKRLVTSETLFGAFVKPEIGLGWGRHSLKVGGILGRDFGAAKNKYITELLFYYNYSAPVYKFNVGIFPMEERIGRYSRAFVSDDERFYDRSIEGFQAAYMNGDSSYAELIFDWVGKVSFQDKAIRERFRIMGGAEYRKWFLKAGANFNMLHFAGSKEIKGVVDNIWVYPYAGLDFSDYIPYVALSVDCGWLQSFQNDRVAGKGYVYPNGLMIDATLETFGAGIYNSLFLGDNMMPYYYTQDVTGKIYGDKLYNGSLFYSTNTGLYDRLEVYYRLLRGEYLDFKVSFVFNFDGNGYMGWQQLASLTVFVNNDFWKNLKKDFEK